MKTDASWFLNRELSWLEFNARVLDEARDKSVPLLERMKFLAITGSNLDEFFMVRVGSLELLQAEGFRATDDAGLTPREQLAAIGQRVRRMVNEQYDCLHRQLEPGLAAAGIRRYTPDVIPPELAGYLGELFDKEILPVITPAAIDRHAGFPYLANLGLNVGAHLADKGRTRRHRFAVIPLGRVLDRFVALPSPEGFGYMLLEDVVRMFIGRLFAGHHVLDAAAFRITRNADLSVREDEAFDFMAQMQDVLQARKRSSCVRLEIQQGAGRPLAAFLQKSLRATDRGVYSVPGPLRLSDFMQLGSLEGFASLKNDPWPAQAHPAIDLRNSIFDEMRKGSVLMYHPYDSFEPVVRLVEEAARDPNVLAIKQVLYRTSADSPIVNALRQAAERGKYVTAMVELKARFDEARNIEWARMLEEAGVQVLYGVRGLKTHAKICVVVRREPDGIRRYIHLGTGNYNEKTARLYSDVSYLSCDDDLATDGTAFFNAIAGDSEPQHLRKLEMAPLGLSETVIGMIEAETERRRRGHDARIMAKMNSLVDADVIRALVAASRAGVRIQLNVRGICCLRPGLKGVSENIEVISIVDRFLEHSRIFYFLHGGEEKLFISSADWMPRNLKRRVELMTPIEDLPSKRRLITILETHFRDTVKGRRLRPDGGYVPIRPRRGEKPLRSQEALYLQSVESARLAQQARRRTLEPYRSPESQEA